MSIDETFDVGADTRSPVDDSYAIPFRFNGTINKLTFKLGPEQLTAQDKEDAAKKLAADRD
jgi:arylsulfatase